MKCPKCGCALPDDSEFCQYCGSKLYVADENIATPDIPIAELPNSAEVQQPSQASSQVSDIEDVVPTQKESDSDSSPAVPENHYTEPPPDASGLTDAPNETHVADKKKKFCKFCGGLIDAETKKCSSCGKQFFRFLKRIVGIIAFVIVLVALAGLNVYQYVSNSATVSDLEQQIKTKDSTISTQKSTIATQKSKINELDNSLADTRELLWDCFDKSVFMDNHIVIVADDGTRKYHKYGCEDLDLSYFWAYNEEAAKGKGYSACSKCCE